MIDFFMITNFDTLFCMGMTMNDNDNGIEIVLFEVFRSGIGAHTLDVLCKVE